MKKLMTIALCSLCLAWASNAGAQGAKPPAKDPAGGAGSDKTANTKPNEGTRTGASEGRGRTSGAAHSGTEESSKDAFRNSDNKSSGTGNNYQNLGASSSERYRKTPNDSAQKPTK